MKTKKSVNSYFLRLQTIISPKKTTSIVKFFVNLGLLFSFLSVSLVLMSQFAGIALTKHYQIVILALTLGIVLLILAKAKNTWLIIAGSMGLIVTGYIFRVLVVKLFNTPLVVEPLYSYVYATNWIAGWFVAPHALIWSHWGVYGLLLRYYMKVFGTSLPVVKSLPMLLFLGFIVLVPLTVWLKNKFSILPLVFLLSFYPAIVLYSNFPSGDIIFVGLMGLTLLLLYWTIEKSTTLSYWFWISFLSISMSFMNLFKEMSIITVPLVVVLLFIKLLERKKAIRIIPTLFVIVFWTTLISSTVYSKLEYFAQGPVNQNKTGYFLATGLNQKTFGQFVPAFYRGYYGGLESKIYLGTISRSDYKNYDNKMANIAIKEVTSNSSIVSFFTRKFNTIWESDDALNRMSSFDSLRGTGAAVLKYENKINAVSSAFYLVVSILLAIDIVFAIKRGEKDMVNLFAIYFSAIFTLALFFIEGSPRYRIVAMPTMIVGAAYGLQYLSEIMNLQAVSVKMAEIRGKYFGK